MMIVFAAFACALFYTGEADDSDFSFFDMNPNRPQQVHISLGEDVSSIVVTWSTYNLTDSVVEYGVDDLTLEAKGSPARKFVAEDYGTFQFIHRVTLPDLKPDTHYKYRCGGGGSWSEVFWFKAVPQGSDWAPRLAVFGDLGFQRDFSVSRLVEEVAAGRYDAIIHDGDFAYDMDSDNGKRGDEFMNLIQPIASHVPYMVAVGNHEVAQNFEYYTERFTMPGTKYNMYYSFDLGPAHFIGFSSEVYYPDDKNSLLGVGDSYPYEQNCLEQFKWLQKDLREASKPESRAKRPWIITFAHKPMYCSTDERDDCSSGSARIRSEGYFFGPESVCPGLEDLFYEHGVDLEIWAHEHVYERLWPVYNTAVYNGSLEHPYKNPRAPVHIISGSAGCIEHSDHFLQNPQPWSALRARDYGYSRMQIFNSTHLYFEQISDEQDGAVIDNFWLIKDKHGPYKKL